MVLGSCDTQLTNYHLINHQKSRIPSFTSITTQKKPTTRWAICLNRVMIQKLDLGQKIKIFLLIRAKSDTNHPVVVACESLAHLLSPRFPHIE